MRFYCSLSIIALFLFQSSQLIGANYRAVNGVMDLRGVSLQGEKPLKLQGNWDFYWQQLLKPSDIRSREGLQSIHANVPSTWNKYLMPSGEKISTAGYGTYHLTILVDSSDQVYAIKLYSIFSAYKLWINGRLIDSAGVVATTKAGSNPCFKVTEFPLKAVYDAFYKQWSIDVVIQVSNFHHRRAGLQQPLYFGTYNSVNTKTKNSLILSLLIIGIILIIGLNHTSMFLINRMDKSNLIFGILCLVMILRDLTTGERLLAQWFPNMNWELLVKLDNFSGFATLALFAFFFYFQIPQVFPKVIFYVIAGIGAIITLLVFATPAWFYGQFRMVFEAYIGLCGLYLVFGVLLRATIRKLPDAFLTFIGMSLLYFTAVSDVLSSSGLIMTAYIAPYGLVSYMLIQSYLLSQKSGTALKQNQKLNQELQQEKQALESHIALRTLELQQQADELKAYHQKQEIQNWINQGLSEVADEIRKNRGELNTVAARLFAVVLKRVNAPMGALYFKSSDIGEDELKLMVNFGLDAEHARDIIDAREGLVGKCFLTAKAIVMEQLPENFFKIGSGLGKALPTAVFIIPLVVDEKCLGVAELASFKAFLPEQTEFIEKAFNNISAQLNIIQMNNKNQQLIEEYRNRVRGANSIKNETEADINNDEPAE
jgi:hypothetical protein